ncbi:alpha/beta hydrolase family protein [Deinococcus hohokamensis]|uniref:Alpha/beta hydrolase family protein n=1 Tax=Deinococcus hohokamensis TaxID=309883 RepID=A0ABV9IBU5_9DEIO
MTIPGLTLPKLPGSERVNLPGPAGVLGGYLWRQAAPAPAALLLHGWGQDAGAMSLPAQLLHAAGWHALSLSQRGWRGSAGCDDYGRNAPADLGAALNWLAQQPLVMGPLVLLGFSMGGLGALLAVSTGETRATHVVAVNPPTDLRAVYDQSSLSLLRRCYDAVLTPEQWRQGSPLTHAGGLRVPALVVVGARDHVCPPWAVRHYARVSGARLLERPDMAHVPEAQDWADLMEAVALWVQEA